MNVIKEGRGKAYEMLERGGVDELQAHFLNPEDFMEGRFMENRRQEEENMELDNDDDDDILGALGG